MSTFILVYKPFKVRKTRGHAQVISLLMNNIFTNWMLLSVDTKENKFFFVSSSV